MQLFYLLHTASFPSGVLLLFKYCFLVYSNLITYSAYALCFKLHPQASWLGKFSISPVHSMLSLAALPLLLWLGLRFCYRFALTLVVFSPGFSPSFRSKGHSSSRLATCTLFGFLSLIVVEAFVFVPVPARWSWILDGQLIDLVVNKVMLTNMLNLLAKGWPVHKFQSFWPIDQVRKNQDHEYYTM